MVTYKAVIESREENKYLKFLIDESHLEIPLTEDDPKKIKSIFNELAKHLKKGLFQFDFEEDDNDLFIQVSKEYISQLNQELTSVYEDLKYYKLLTDEKLVNK